MKEEKKAKKEKSASLVKGADFYIEKGRYVFTEQFLRNRGHCCESGCRHCPYGFKEKVGKRRESSKRSKI